MVAQGISCVRHSFRPKNTAILPHSACVGHPVAASTVMCLPCVDGGDVATIAYSAPPASAASMSEISSAGSSRSNCIRVPAGTKGSPVEARTESHGEPGGCICVSPRPLIHFVGPVWSQRHLAMTIRVSPKWGKKNPETAAREGSHEPNVRCCRILQKYFHSRAR